MRVGLFYKKTTSSIYIPSITQHFGPSNACLCFNTAPSLNYTGS
jgi:hypothetical protein